MPFSKLIGNDLAKAALLRMTAQKSVPNTLLFYGPEGVGKSLFALGLAELLMGEKSAAKLAHCNHPDLYIFRPEGKSAIHPIENMRKLIDEAALPPYEAPVKVFILHDADQMLASSSNALLKTFEEPPHYCYFILLTTAVDAMLPTILSRCRKVPFFPIPQPQIEQLVQEKWQKSPETARRVAFLSHGSLAKAEQLAQGHEMTWRAQLLEILTLRLPAEYPQFLKLATEIEEKCTPEEGEETEEASLLHQADLLLEEILSWYRDLHLLKEGISLEFLYHLDSLERLKTASSLSFPTLEKVIDLVSQSRLSLQRHVKLRTVLEHFFLALS